MKKRYLFVAVVLLAAGLVFTGCDLLEPEEDGTDNVPPGKYTWTIYGTAEGNKNVVIEFTTKEDKKPQKDDTYKIYYDNNPNPVSSGRIDVSGSAATPTITFNPNSGNSFEATLDNAKLAFSKGIPTSTGTIMGYRSQGSGNPIDPVFDAGGDLASATITLVVGDTGEKATLKVTVKSNGNGGGAPYYQWYRNGTAILGETNASYTVPTNTAGTFSYYVKVGNPTGGVNTSKTQVVNVISTEIVVGNGTGETPLHNLKEAIETLFTASNNGITYTVNFNTNLPYPLFINDKDFPGNGKVTIKSKGITLTKGIYITRSNVELNGLKINITDTKDAALYWDTYFEALKTNNIVPCAVLISNQYLLGSPNLPLAENKSYNAYSSYNSAIKSVSIVNCDIAFNAIDPTPLTNPIMGIYVDPYTAGRTSDTRIKIKGTTVRVTNGPDQSAFCFMGNNTDLSGNTFTSSGIVARILFLFALTYGETTTFGESITFANNSFNSSGIPVFMISVNYASQIYNDIPSTGFLEKISDKNVCTTFGLGPGKHKFSELPSKYRWFIENLFAQIIAPPFNRGIYLYDFHKDVFHTDGVTPQGQWDEYYVMGADNVIAPTSH